MMTALIVTGLLATAQPPAERPNEPPDLTDAQQSALEQLRKERDRKTSQTWMGTALRIAGLVNSARIQSDRPVAETGLAVAHEVTGSLLAAQKARSDYHEKLRTLLTDEQRQRFDELTPRRRPRGPD
jgi:hypothetical protein